MVWDKVGWNYFQGGKAEGGVDCGVESGLVPKYRLENNSLVFTWELFLFLQQIMSTKIYGKILVAS